MFKFHKHSWKVIRVTQGTYSGGFGGGVDATQIYWKCETCKKTKLETKEGLWNWGDFE